MLGRVALVAAQAEVSMEVVRGRGVVGRTVSARCWAQEGVRKSTFDQSAVIAVTGAAILLDELLVERSVERPLGQALDRGTARGPNSDVCHDVASDASVGRCAAKGRMAGETIAFELGMRRHKGARAHHRAGIHECEHDQANEVGHDDDPDPRPLHGRLQNTRTAMM
jgi:hypothetical protein